MNEPTKTSLEQQERRAPERVRVLWFEDNASHSYEPILVERPADDSLPDESTWGLVYDISRKGVRLYLSREDRDTPERFQLKIYPPEGAPAQWRAVRVEEVWRRDISAVCCEVGCQFIGISERQAQTITELVGYFKGLEDRKTTRVRCALIP